VFEVYGLEDWQPYALACKACTDHVLEIVTNAHAVFEPAAPRDCELFYDGICEQHNA
jgi:hypothetical protein